MVKDLLRKVVLSCLLGFVAACNHPSEEKSRHLGISEDCDAAVSTCYVTDGAIRVSLVMGPTVKPLQPFPILFAVDTGEHVVENVVVDFQMQGMDMGVNRYRLIRQGEGWTGSVILPVCTTSRVDWHAIVEFSLDGQPALAVFSFHSVVD